jgi:hypothetical protein
MAVDALQLKKGDRVVEIGSNSVTKRARHPAMLNVPSEEYCRANRIAVS